jgi:hypothetical protein
MHTILTTSFVIVGLALTGCEKGESSKETASETAAVPTSHAQHQHADPGVKVGSHDDWCGGHKVPESMCTRCNASLIPAFKATGDWCAEHGLPESQCLLCNPDLKIERPPKTGGN